MGLEQCLDLCQVATSGRVMNRVIPAATSKADQYKRNCEDGGKVEKPVHGIGIRRLSEIGKCGLQDTDFTD